MTDVLVTPKLEKKNTQTAVKLQNIILPNLDICTVEELFLRVNSKCFINYEQNRVELKKSGNISFDTYFNSFSIQKWKEYTSVKTISVNLHLEGKFKVMLLNVDYFSESVTLVNQKVITTDRLDEVNVFTDIDIQPYKGLFYVEIEALEGNCLFTGGYFHTNVNLYQEDNKKIAIVICTYKRETYVNKNIQLLEKHLLNKPNIGNKFEIFVIDNGKTLNNFNSSQIHLIPNKNAGGSGGYTRGLIEVLERKHDFSHIVFMDDDVVVDPEVFERIYNFQKVAYDKSLCIGGSMLRLDTKYIQYENGAVWDKEVIRLKPDLDLRLVKNILFNEIEEHISFNGWWLFCFSTQVIDSSNLPYPFFIKMDDMELPIRLKYKIITLNGVCVWHEALETKYSPVMNYYLKKNELILNVLCSDSFGTIAAIKRIIKFSLREAFCYRYKSANLVLKATSDFLEGPDYLKAIDPEKKNLEILSMGEKAVKKPELPFVYNMYEESLCEKENTLHRLMRFITLNGHLLPSLLFHKDEKLVDKGYRIVPIQCYRPINVFRARKALYYNLINQEGFVVRISRLEFFRVFVKTIAISLKILFNFSTLKQLYRKTLPELTNKAFWENYLEINKYSKLEQ